MTFAVTVDKTKLVDILKVNRAEHKELFDTAIEKYREKIIAYLNTSIDTVKNGGKIEHYIHLPIPEEHLSEYDRVIGMLELHLEAEITIPENLYRMYVDNEWGWSHSFASNTASYSNG